MNNNKRTSDQPMDNRARGTAVADSQETEQARGVRGWIFDKGGRIVDRYPGACLATGVLVGAALGWWVKRKE